MKNILSLSLIFGSALLAPVSACVGRAEASDAVPVGVPPARLSFRADHGQGAWVERSARPGGGERLRGELLVGGTRLVEEVQIDPSGRLERAELALDGARPLRVVLDAALSELRIQRAAGTTTLRIPNDAPWAFAPLVDASGRALPSPIGAWVTMRAAGAADSVRLVNVTVAKSDVVPADQLAMPTEVGTTVVLGWDGADIGAGFVDQVRVGDLSLTLARSAGQDDHVL